MELHRTGKRPDWLKRRKRDYSWVQKIARNTGGIVTPGNVLTVIGFVVTLYGLWLLTEARFGAAIVALLFGRLCDIADGWAADRTGTKSPVGELLDASCDKVVTILGLVALGVSGLAPWWVLAVVAAPQVVISIVGGLALYHRRRLHPSSAGKLSMVFAWLGFGGLVIAAWANGHTLRTFSLAVGYASVATAVILSSYALAQYFREYREGKND